MKCILPRLFLFHLFYNFIFFLRKSPHFLCVFTDLFWFKICLAFVEVRVNCLDRLTKGSHIYFAKNWNDLGLQHPFSWLPLCCWKVLSLLSASLCGLFLCLSIVSACSVRGTKETSQTKLPNFSLRCIKEPSQISVRPKGKAF